MSAINKSNGQRHSILDLAPLELECMNALWPLGEATVREIQAQLTARRPRAYTTVMTIMDRLAHKGVVTRRRSGRAWVYQPGFSASEARERAIRQLVQHFFAGSADELLAHLKGQAPPVRADAPHDESSAQSVAVRPKMDEVLL
jgi:predicted transcriptional regulator